ncbi:DUF4231 domain-containing protein [Actinomadura sp. ATCC 31491]|uniref:DUF4231 domain-containing protein n=1 Tax=Actinomadura luzonensis TaxID=2805427 RepID=A0ABT0G2G7_9ACTN|nr:DUF4231 domain-containing protein [Actinomadura luzonensis]MCK2218296.1 DUF4231 domain-containing protein [Actinomadura luzonensis]
MRFPAFRASVTSWPVIPSETRAAYPELVDDFEVLDRELTPAFTAYDGKALRDQNRYRRQQVLILLGSTLIAGLGGLQAVLPEQRWPSILVVVVGVALAASSRYAHESETLDSYLSRRVKAERLRAQYFRYLSRTGSFAGEDREIALRRAVLAIESNTEPE